MASSLLPRVAVFGCDRQIDTLCSVLSRKGFPIQALWAPRKSSSLLLAAAHNIPLRTTNYKEILISQDIELIVLATIPEWTESLVKEASRMGQNVIACLPVCKSSLSCESLLEACEYYPQTLSVVIQPLRFLPQVVSLRSRIMTELSQHHHHQNHHYGKNIKFSLFLKCSVDMFNRRNSCYFNCHSSQGSLSILLKSLIDLLFFIFDYENEITSVFFPTDFYSSQSSTSSPKSNTSQPSPSSTSSSSNTSPTTNPNQYYHFSGTFSTSASFSITIELLEAAASSSPSSSSSSSPASASSATPPPSSQEGNSHKKGKMNQKLQQDSCERLQFNIQVSGLRDPFHNSTLHAPHTSDSPHTPDPQEQQQQQQQQQEHTNNAEDSNNKGSTTDTTGTANPWFANDNNNSRDAINKERVIHGEDEGDGDKQREVSSGIMAEDGDEEEGVDRSYFTCPLVYRGLVAFVEKLREAFEKQPDDPKKWSTEPLIHACSFRELCKIQAVMDALQASSLVQKWVTPNYGSNGGEGWSGSTTTSTTNINNNAKSMNAIGKY